MNLVPPNQRVINKEEEDYNEALGKLKQELHNVAVEKQGMVLEAQKTIDHVEKLKREGKEPLSMLTQSLRNTLLLLQGKMTPEEYHRYAKKLEDSSSIGVKILGGIMLTLGLLFITFGFIALFTEISLLVGVTSFLMACTIGIELSANATIHLGFFGEKNKALSASGHADTFELFPLGFS